MSTVAPSIREEAAERFRELGWPTTRQEEWKYTNVAPIAKIDWRAGGLKPAATLVSGKARIVPIGEVRPAELAQYFGRLADWQRNAFVALNTANAQDGAFIVVDPGAEATVRLSFEGEGDDAASHPHNVIVAGRGSQLSIVESYSGRGRYFTNSVTELFAGEGSVIDHYKLECESKEAFHVGTMHVRQERSSNVTSHSIALGGALVRNDVNVALAGEGATLTLDGLFVVNGNQHIDNHTLIDHIAPHCESHELYKGILDDHGRGIFDGRIIVRPNAQKTVSRQENRNLLLSETAIVDSKP
ncbi:MAG TPA: SufD family Fe-S cluster assembly protein, partial [Thermoanaerobaculia bacterium]|nr:SufD family Fe-S cluster assembly protein [Thermoanaerobaculia bacterium]